MHANFFSGISSLWESSKFHNCYTDELFLSELYSSFKSREISTISWEFSKRVVLVLLLVLSKLHNLHNHEYILSGISSGLESGEISPIFTLIRIFLIEFQVDMPSKFRNLHTHEHFLSWFSMGRVDLLVQNWFHRKSKGRQCKGRWPRNFDFFSWSSMPISLQREAISTIVLLLMYSVPQKSLGIGCSFEFTPK